MSYAEELLEKYNKSIETEKQDCTKILQDRIDNIDRIIEILEEKDPVAESMKELYTLCQRYDQLFNPSKESKEEFIVTTKICKVYLRDSREIVKKVYGKDVLAVEGFGYYLPVEGIYATRGFKERSGYAKWEFNPRERIHINFSEVPNGYRRDLPSPAFDGLFFPKNDSFVQTFDRVFQISFFNVK